MKPWIEAEAEALAKEREIKGKNRYLPYGAKYPPAGGGLQRWEMWDACMKRAWNDVCSSGLSELRPSKANGDIVRSISKIQFRREKAEHSQPLSGISRST